jgi:hypothetical protein
LTGLFWTFLDLSRLSGLVWTCLNLSAIVRTCLGLFDKCPIRKVIIGFSDGRMVTVLVWTFLDLSALDRTCLDSFDSIVHVSYTVTNVQFVN